jgi:RNA polymerase sigma-70 factor (ECF subfamily)
LNSPQHLPQNDETLIREFVLTGDENAFESLIRKHLPSLRRLVAAAGAKTREDREDVLQETLIRLHEALSSYRFDAPLTTYMFRIGRNAALDIERKKNRRAARERRAALGEPALIQNPEEQAVENLRAAELKKLFYRLKEKDRQLLLLREYEKMSMDEIAGVMGIPPGTVKSRLSRARKRARKLYEEVEK